MFLNRKVIILSLSLLKINIFVKILISLLDTSQIKKAHISEERHVYFYIKAHQSKTFLKAAAKVWHFYDRWKILHMSLSNMKTIYDFVSKSEDVFRWLQSLLRFNLCLNCKWSKKLEMQITVLPLGNFAEVDGTVCSRYLSDVLSLIGLGTKACPIQFCDEI